MEAKSRGRSTTYDKGIQVAADSNSDHRWAATCSDCNVIFLKSLYDVSNTDQSEDRFYVIYFLAYAAISTMFFIAPISSKGKYYFYEFNKLLVLNNE